MHVIELEPEIFRIVYLIVVMIFGEDSHDEIFYWVFLDVPECSCVQRDAKKTPLGNRTVISLFLFLFRGSILHPPSTTIVIIATGIQRLVIEYIIYHEHVRLDVRRRRRCLPTPRNDGNGRTG